MPDRVDSTTTPPEKPVRTSSTIKSLGDLSTQATASAKTASTRSANAKTGNQDSVYAVAEDPLNADWSNAQDPMYSFDNKRKNTAVTSLAGASNSSGMVVIKADSYRICIDKNFLMKSPVFVKILSESCMVNHHGIKTVSTNQQVCGNILQMSVQQMLVLPLPQFKGLAVKYVFEQLQHPEYMDQVRPPVDPVIALDIILLLQRYFPQDIDKKRIKFYLSMQWFSRNLLQYLPEDVFQVLERCQNLEVIFPEYIKIWKKVRKCAIGSVKRKKDLRQAILSNQDNQEMVFKHLQENKF